MMNDEPKFTTIVVQHCLFGALKLGKLSDVIAKLQSYVSEVPEEFRDAVRIDVMECFPSDVDISLVYDRLKTEEELEARLEIQNKILQRWGHIECLIDKKENN